MASFSFYFGHQMSTIEGGMVSCSDRQFADLLLMLRSHGWSKDAVRTASELVDEYQIDDFHSPFVFTSRDSTSVRRISMPFSASNSCASSIG